MHAEEANVVALSRQLPCTIFCACGAANGVCHNPFNWKDDGDMEEDC